jgi:hypothetical protein
MRYLDPGRDPRSHAGHERRIDWLEKHATGTGLSLASASYFGSIASGTDVEVSYDQFVTNEDSLFSLSGGRLQILDEGVFAFIQWADIIPTGAPAATTEVVMTPSLTGDTFGTVPIGFFWPDFGQLRVPGTSNLNWYPRAIMFRSYADEAVTSEQYLQFTIPFTTSNCVVATTVIQIADPLTV